MVIDYTRNNMTSLIDIGNHGSISTTYTYNMVYYVVKFISNPVTLQ